MINPDQSVGEHLSLGAKFAKGREVKETKRKLKGKGKERGMKSRGERKAKLMEIAEKEVEEVLEWMEESAAPDLGEIEAIVLRLRKRLGEAMAEEVIGNQATIRPGPGPICEQCGNEMHYKGMKSKEISSMIGEVKLKRGYYYCDRCRTGLFPPGQAVGGTGKELVGEHHP
jgi:transposase